MSERLKFLGRRQELELEKKALDIRIQGIIKNLREELNPLTPVEALRPEVVATWSEDLDTAQARFREVVAELKQITDLIGK